MFNLFLIAILGSKQLPEALGLGTLLPLGATLSFKATN